MSSADKSNHTETMSARILASLVMVACLMNSWCAHAQQAKRIPRIGYLSNTDPTSEFIRSEAVRIALGELGYAAGQNVAFEYRYAKGDVHRAFKLATELATLKVDVILVAGGAPWVNAAKSATRTIPIVMLSGGSDPVEEGLVKSLARPGGNVTGVSLLNRELGGKRLELFKEAVPKLARVALIYDPAIPAFTHDVEKLLPVAAKALGLTLKTWEIRAADELARVFATLSKERPDGLFFPPGGPLTFTDVKRIAELALQIRVPSMFINKKFVEAGGLMSYGADRAESDSRVAYFVDRILKGAKPADLPVEQPMKFEFAINLRTAKQIGLTIPPNVLARADKVIK